MATLDEAIEKLSPEEIDLLNSDSSMLKEFQQKFSTPYTQDVNKPVSFVDNMKDTAKQAVQAALPSPDFNKPIQPESAVNGLSEVPQAAVEAAGQTLRDPTRISPTLSEPGRAAGDYVAEKGGEAGVNPYVAAGAGFAAQVGLDPQSYLPLGGQTVGKAVIPADRSLAVKLAQELNAPITRAEATGSRAAGGIENALEKTLSGSDEIANVRQAQATKLQDFKDALVNTFGTKNSPRDTGMAVQSAIQDHIDATKETAKSLYSQIPDMPVPTKNLEKVATDILEEQKRLPSVDQNSGLIRRATEYLDWSQNTKKEMQESGAKNFTDLPVAKQGATEGKPHAIYVYDQKLSPDEKGIPYVNLFGDKAQIEDMTSKAGAPHGWGSSISLEEANKLKIPVVGKKSGVNVSDEALALFKRKPVYAAGYEASPATTSEAPKFSLDVLRKVQSDLNGIFHASKRNGQAIVPSEARAYAQISDAIDKDVEGLSSAKEPLTRMLGQEATDKLTKANSVWGTMRSIDTNPLIKRIRKADPADVPSMIFKDGSASDVMTARASMSDEAFKAAKQHYFSDLIKDPLLEKHLSKLDPEFLQTTFNRAELDALHKTTVLHNFFGSAEKIGATSGSARTNTALATGGAVGAGILSAMHGNPAGVVAAATAAFGPKFAAKAYLKYGMSGVKVPNFAPGVVAAMDKIRNGHMSPWSSEDQSKLQSLRDRLNNNAK